MDITNVIAYLRGINVLNNDVVMEQITVGASGAKLYLIKDGNKKYVLKIMHESFDNEINHIESYKKEFLFYELNKELKLPYIPNIIYSEIHNEYGIILLMEYYKAIRHNQWNINLQKQAVDICARFNSIDITKMSKLNLHYNECKIDKDFTERSYQEWKFVLSQHRGRFNNAIVDEIYENIEIICPIINNEPHYVCHGDFHPENVLFDGSKLYICDWQNINIGKCIGDISFFISRGIGFGIKMNSDELIDYYCEKLSEYKGVNISKTTLLKEKHAAAVLNIFSFWAYHLKNSSYERVAGQFNEMENSYKYLLN